MKHIHILGISGTFMSALAIIAREAGYTVTGCDTNCYPPVSDLLRDKGITWEEGYDVSEQALKADCIIVGNAVKRGMPVIESILDLGKPYISGPQWLSEVILSRYRVIAVAGTHGKTTTTAMLTHILHQAGMAPGFLIGGIAPNFQTSASLGLGDYFVIEADEYDTAFFDKRPKFMHYRPEIAILNNLEFDHADIYPDLAAIQLQFHYLMRTIPPKGLVLKPRDDEALNAVVAKGKYCPIEQMALTGNTDWSIQLLEESGSAFSILHRGNKLAEIHWSLIGLFNVENALSAFSASMHIGVKPETAAKALESFIPVKRRLEIKSNRNGITIYDDFAHHPTAITKTISALKKSKRHRRIIVIMEFASYTMRTGVHRQAMEQALEGVDITLILQPLDFAIDRINDSWSILPSVDAIIMKTKEIAKEGDGILIMSNRGFGNIHQLLADTLELSDL